MYKYILSYSTLLLIFSPFIVGCSNDDNQDTPTSLPEFDLTLSIEENIDTYVGQLIESDVQAGISIAVVKDESVIVRKNYGLANISDGIQNTSDTSFYIASVSKQFTAMAIMILEERGLLSYDDKLASYLDDTPSSWSEISIHHLLTHQSGIPDYFSIPDFSTKLVNNSKVLKKVIEKGNLDFVPGENSGYSNSGYIALAHIVEVASSQSFKSFIEENIFDQLDMTRSFVVDESNPDIIERAYGYTSKASKIDNPDGLNDFDQFTVGDGGIFSTINDLIKWDQALYSEALVTKETFAKAYTAHEPSGYGYGWFVLTFDDKNLYHHAGGLNGFRTAIGRFPDQNLTIIMLSNGTYEWAFDLYNKVMQFHT